MPAATVGVLSFPGPGRQRLASRRGAGASNAFAGIKPEKSPQLDIGIQYRGDKLRGESGATSVTPGASASAGL
ncbi:hypothetical protein CDR19_13300 [Ectopseudomonas toyotomiensis]|nr:hypothetical protein CDR19_13300 [Pseudomonas toyotomiensis]